jgi:hypothetical protein
MGLTNFDVLFGVGDFVLKHDRVQLLLAQGSFLPLNNKRALDYSLARAL